MPRTLEPRPELWRGHHDAAAREAANARRPLSHERPPRRLAYRDVGQAACHAAGSPYRRPPAAATRPSMKRPTSPLSLSGGT